MVEKIEIAGRLYAIIIRADYDQPGIHFFTPPSFSQQLAYMKHPKGKLIEPHRHNPVPREVIYTQEVLLLRKGKLKVNFFDDEGNLAESIILEKGDLILLASGGHGFEVLEQIEMIEVKQGPYTGEDDKERFEVN